MAFSGGVYTLPTPALVPGQIVSSSENNTVRNDMAASFNLTWLRNGTAAATANIPMGSFKLTGLGAATTNGDALSYGNAAVVTTLTSTSLTATRVPYAGTGGLLQDASTFTFDGTTLTAGGFTTSGAISAGTITASGAITVSGGTANGVAYLNGSKVLTTGSALTFDGTTLTNTGGLMKLADDGQYFWGAGSTSILGSSAVGRIQFYASGSEQMRLTSTGLGIGTSSPAGKLHVDTGTNNFNAVRIAASSATGGSYGIGIGSGSNLTIYSNGISSTLLSLTYDGNLGLGVTPSAWDATYKAFQTPAGSIGAYSTTFFEIDQNAYWSSAGYKYVNNGYASQYRQTNGTHTWTTAPSGTAGNAITFTQAMTLDASGNLGLGTSSPAGWNGRVLSVASSANDAGIRFDGNLGSWGIGGCGTATGSNALRFYNFTAGSEAMRIDSSGNVGIGTSSPNAQLNLSKSASGAVGPEIRLNNDASTSGDAARISLAYSTSLRAALDMQIATSGTGEFLFKSGNGTLTERMRIDSSGNLLVGLSSTILSGLTASLQVGPNAPATNAFNKSPVVNNTYSSAAGIPNFMWNAPGPYCGIGSHSTSTSSPVRIGTITATAGSGFSWSGGYPDLFSGAYTNASDYRLKENVQDYADEALAQVAAMRPVTYKMKDIAITKDGENITIVGKDSIGFIAHEMQQIVPMLVTGIKDGPEDQGIDYAKLTTVLVKAIQELKAELDATKAEVAALKGN